MLGKLALKLADSMCQLQGVTCICVQQKADMLLSAVIPSSGRPLDKHTLQIPHTHEPHCAEQLVAQAWQLLLTEPADAAWSAQQLQLEKFYRFPIAATAQNQIVILPVTCR